MPYKTYTQRRSIMPKVFVFAPVGKSHRAFEEAGCEVVLGKSEWHQPGGGHEADMIAMAQGSQAYYGTGIRNSPITQKLLETCSDLRIVAKTSIGCDDVDLDAATEMGILVTHAPVEWNWGNIAEVTVTFMLALLKRLNQLDATIKEGGWWTDGSQGRYVGKRFSDGYEGVVVGIIGLGRIGGRVAHLLRPWNVTMLCYDPYIPVHRFLEFGVKSVDLETLLRTSDVVTMHTSLTKETRHMMGAEQFAMMKREAYFLNTSRGLCHDEAALCDALESGVIAGAGLNAFEVEPIAPDSPLRRMGDKVLLRPHGGKVPATIITAGRSEGEATRWATNDVLRALRGELPIHVYNPDAIGPWRKRFGGKSVL